MEIRPVDVDTIEEMGELNGSSVKLIRTKGGFWISLGRSKRGGADEPLAAGSHPAIVRYTVEKKHPDFRPVMAKSALSDEPHVVECTSHFLGEKEIAKGYDIFVLQKSSRVDICLTRHGVEQLRVVGEVEGENLVVRGAKARAELPNVKQAIARTALGKAASVGAKRVKFEVK